MLELFEVFTTSGIVLFSKKLTAKSRPEGLINNLIKDVFIEERAGGGGLSDAPAVSNATYRQDRYTLRWTGAKDLGLVFVAVYQSLVHLAWVDKLLDNLKTIFVQLYGDEVRNPYVSSVACSNFTEYFDQQVHELEGTDPSPSLEASTAELTPPSSSGEEAPPPPPPVPNASLLKTPPQPKSVPTSTDATPVATPDTSRPSTPASTLPKGSRRAKREAAQAARAAALGAASTPASSGDESRKKAKPKAAAGKQLRKWTSDGQVDVDDDKQLDYSAAGEEGTAVNVEAIDASTVGTRTKQGQFVLRDLDDEIHSILRDADAKKAQSGGGSSGLVGTGLSKISGLFRNVVGGKTLTKADMDKALKEMEKHLLEKNVARDAAVRICEGVERDLAGKTTRSFESIDSAIRESVRSSLQRMLTPTSSLDLLRSISAVTKPSAANPFATARPYVISVVGVNGVGKSTNLSKLAYFLLQNDFRLLIAACDTFRSGAVEQLRVHVRNLAELCEREGRGAVELFERGYGKDAADIAKQAVQYGADNRYDVVLIDTAGRQVSNQRLMGSLEKFAQLAKPDKIFMVGEALVGSDSVAQAKSFNASFGRGRQLDGFIISKCDTVGDMVGTLISMVDATRIPVVFLGVGQHYGDLRTMNVNWAVGLLMS